MANRIAHDASRRSFLGRAAAVGAVTVASGSASLGIAAGRASSFVDLLQTPETVIAYGGFRQTIPVDAVSLALRGGERWSGGGVEVESKREGEALRFTLTSPAKPIALVHVRWKRKVSGDLTVLGDAWERSYGELGWRNLLPERVLPWYFATFDSKTCHGYGVKTDAAALCFWQVDQGGVSLWMNVTNGGDGVQLGERSLVMATVVAHRGVEDSDALESVRALCNRMCARRSRPTQPIYGANDWCYAYGRSTAETILQDTDFLVEVSPAGGARPFSVIDGGWSNGTAAWPDMGRLAAGIKQRTARAGLWVRPLEATEKTPRGWLLPDARFGEKTGRARELAYDVTVPEACERIAGKFREVAAWGYEMVKHDFSTYDLLGQWGFEMGPQPSLPGWSLHDRSITNAEAVTKLYRLIRDAVGDKVLVDGCNTIGHLGQGHFDLQRTGDDTSGRQWERTRRMGVNTLAFRLPQHGSFYMLDADLVGVTEAVPWALNRQWLDVLARSGTATMVSPGPPARGTEGRAALREAFQIAAAGGTSARPVDWMHTSAPQRWREAGGKSELRYDWNGAAGASAFLGP